MADDGFEEEKDEEDDNDGDGDDDDKNIQEDEWVFVIFFLLIFFGACCQRGRMRRGYKKILTFCFSSACLEDQQELHVLFLQLRISSVSCELRIAKTLFM